MLDGTQLTLSTVAEGPELNKSTVIGISVAILGNVLISFALNVQKLAHKRLEAAEQNKGQVEEEDVNGHVGPLHQIDEASERTHSHSTAATEDEIAQENPPAPTPSESRPLLPFPKSSSRSDVAARDYGASSSSSQIPASRRRPRQSLISRIMASSSPSLGRRAGFDAMHRPQSYERPVAVPVDVVTADASTESHKPKPKGEDEDDSEDADEGNESDYLKSKLWWLGFILMNVGEIGNFISYAWAPASVVAPLGTFALIANCFFAPLILKERFRKRDILGIVLAVVGAVTVVLSSPSSSEGDPRLNPDQLVAAISKTPFLVYSIVYIIGIAVLVTLSRTNTGKRIVFIDVGVCALFGGFTVLSTKAVSTLLTMAWIKIFTLWITYPVVAVLLLTGVGQIRYLNRALKRFDSKVVIPIQFVLFNLSAIIGSSILYEDFKNAKFHQIVTFLYGCAATFAGVFVIAWSSNQNSDTHDNDGQDDNGPFSPLSDPADEDAALEAIARRRKRPTLILPPNVAMPGQAGPGSAQPGGAPPTMPILRHKPSSVSMMALSSAQHLLLVHTPPREVPHTPRDLEQAQTPDSYRPRRMSWFGAEGPRHNLSRERGSERRESYPSSRENERGSVPPRRNDGSLTREGQGVQGGSRLRHGSGASEGADAGETGGASASVGSESSSTVSGRSR